VHSRSGSPENAEAAKIGRNQRAKEVLEALYAIRRNVFHGQKGFEIAQLALLRPVISLLESTVEILYGALERDR
jgi:hypothetical protein